MTAVTNLFVLLLAHFLKTVLKALSVEWAKMIQFTEQNCGTETAVSNDRVFCSRSILNRSNEVRACSSNVKGIHPKSMYKEE